MNNSFKKNENRFIQCHIEITFIHLFRILKSAEMWDFLLFRCSNQSKLSLSKASETNVLWSSVGRAFVQTSKYEKKFKKPSNEKNDNTQKQKNKNGIWLTNLCHG